MEKVTDKMERVADKVTDMFTSNDKQSDVHDDKLFGKDAAGTEKPLVSSDDQLFGKDAAGLKIPPSNNPHLSETIKSPLAQGHIQPEGSGDETDISAPAGLTPMTGQYVVERRASNVSDEEFKKHGTAVGLASATMASGAVGEQNPSNS